MHRASRPDQDRLAELITHAAAGDAEAFAAFYDALVPYVYPMIRSLVDDGLVEAVAQRAFTDMWRSAAHCPSTPGAVTGWAMAIVVDRIAENVGARTRGRRFAALSDDTGAPPQVSPGPAPGAGDQLRRGLLGLSEGQRTSILLAYHGRLTVGQTARVLAVAPGVAVELLRDGLVSLGPRLAGSLPAERDTRAHAARTLAIGWSRRAHRDAACH